MLMELALPTDIPASGIIIDPALSALRPRLEFLDSLRGLAAIYVVIFHAALVPLPALALPEYLKPLVMFGGSGVTLFFVISAFSLTLRMPAHMARSGLKSYFVSRIFRIAPLFYVLLLFSVFRDEQRFGAFPEATKIVANATFVFNFISGWQTGIVWASWTIGVEMGFYLIFPFLYFLAPDLPRKGAIFCVSVLVYLLLPVILQQRGFDGGAITSYQSYSLAELLPTFAIGMIDFDLYSRMTKSQIAGWFGLVLIATAVAGLAALAYGAMPSGILETRHVQAIFYTALLLGAAATPIRLIVNRVFSFFGAISYSVYLWHAPAIFASSPVYRSIYGFGLPDLLSFILSVLYTFAVVTPISWATYHLVEVPGEKLGKRLLRKHLAVTHEPHAQRLAQIGPMLKA